MRTFQRLLMIILVVFTLCFCKKDDVKRPEALVCNLEDVQYQTNPKSVRYQSIIKHYVSQGLPGIILLVKDDNGFYIGSAGMADVKKGVKLQPCHVSKVCSVSKIFLGVAILRLQERGILSLDDPISKYIEHDVLGKIANGDKPITIRNLMNHTSGFYDVITDQGFYLQVLNNPAKHWTADDLLPYIYDKKEMFGYNPADTAGYSNTNYLLLTMIIEKATGKRHDRVLHEEVIDLLGLNDTYYFYHDPLPADRVAQGYYDLYNNNTLINLSNWNTGSGNGYGGLYSTVWDMYLFLDALFVKKTLLKQATLDQMLVFHHTMEERKYIGVACFKDFIDIGNDAEDYAWGHRGRDLSYSADAFYFPEHRAFMTMIVNYGTDGNSNLRPVFREMRDEVAKVIIED